MLKFWRDKKDPVDLSHLPSEATDINLVICKTSKLNEFKNQQDSSIESSISTHPPLVQTQNKFSAPNVVAHDTDKLKTKVSSAHESNQTLAELGKLSVWLSKLSFKRNNSNNKKEHHDNFYSHSSPPSVRQNGGSSSAAIPVDSPRSAHKKWFQWNFKSASSNSINVPGKFASIDDSVAAASDPVIRAPGRLPESHQYRKRHLMKPDLTEEQEKLLKRNDIIDIVRGKIKLVTEFTQKYELVEILGDGAFGFVFAAKILSGSMAGKEAAVKFIVIDKVSSEGWVEDPTYGYIPFEAHFLRKVRHPNMIQFYDFYKDERYFYLVTELHGVEWRPDNPLLNPIDNPGIREPVNLPRSGGANDNSEKPQLSQMSDDDILARKRTAFDLFECIDVHKRIPEPTTKKIFLGILNAVDYMHKLGFVHRDLKDENVVIDEKYQVKLIDFGSTSKIPALGNTDNYFDRFNGTLHFASPEILRGNNYRGPEAEVWALGVLLYTVVYGENPFRTPEDILRGTVNYYGRENTLCVDLIKKIFTASPIDRITLDGIKTHPWLYGTETVSDRNY